MPRETVIVDVTPATERFLMRCATRVPNQYSDVVTLTPVTAGPLNSKVGRGPGI